MSEALEVRKKAEARSLKLPGPKPPLVAQRPAMPSEIPRAARSFLRAAVTAQWAAQAFYALGWRTDTGGHLTGQLRASVLIRMRRGEERAIAVWETPWPLPDGVEPPGMDTPPVLADHLPRFPGMAERVAILRQQRLALLERDVAVKWAYSIGTHWTRGKERPGWLSATELRNRVVASP